MTGDEQRQARTYQGSSGAGRTSHSRRRASPPGDQKDFRQRVERWHVKGSEAAIASVSPRAVGRHRV